MSALSDNQLVVLSYAVRLEDEGRAVTTRAVAATTRCEPFDRLTASDTDRIGGFFRDLRKRGLLEAYDRRAGERFRIWRVTNAGRIAASLHSGRSR
jgi:hypothetical protein